MQNKTLYLHSTLPIAGGALDPHKKSRGKYVKTGEKVTVFHLRKKQPVLRIRIRIRIHMFLGLPDPDPDPLVRCMDPEPDPTLDPDPDPSIIMQK